MSRQHYESCVESGIPAKLYSGSEESLKTKEGEILILEITKLVKDKTGEGVSVDVDYFSESKNLVFIDEGHKGQKSEERAWKNLREHLTRGEDSFIKELEDKIKVMYEKDDNTLPSIHFDKHLYSPIASIADGTKFKEIKTVPVRLNEGERDFIVHLRQFVKESDKFKDKQLFVLRNLSVKGMGFFMDSSSFYPDFILWVVDGKKQYIYFLDPKGILLGETHFNNPKVLWCNNDASALEAKIQADLIKDKKDVEVHISAFILSVTSFEKVRKVWSDGNVTRDKFAENKVLFIEKNKDYITTIFSNITHTK